LSGAAGTMKRSCFALAPPWHWRCSEAQDAMHAAGSAARQASS
jgi:hypothetical protein